MIATARASRALEILKDRPRGFRVIVPGTTENAKVFLGAGVKWKLKKGGSYEVRRR